MTSVATLKLSVARYALCGVIGFALAGCAELEFPSLNSVGDPATASGDGVQSTRLVERDVEAPDVFQVNEAGLWDGRPSLGGIWVAHPDVQDPERVIIRNAANDQFVIGALFRRERDIPGPRLQASSDAAEALGMLAGAPVQLNVTALRRETVEDTPPPEDEAQTLAAAPAPEPVAEQSLDPIAGAAAAIEASELPSTPAEIDAGTTTETALAGADVPLDADATSEDALVAAVEPAAEKTPFWPWNRKKAQAEPEITDVELTAAVATGVAATAAAQPVDTAPVDTPKPQPAAAPAPRVSSLDKPFIQIGIFSVKGNADRTADQMRRAGMVPTVFKEQLNGKEFWRVVVGPATSKSERQALLTTIKETGFTDAYAVRK